MKYAVNYSNLIKDSDLNKFDEILIYYEDEYKELPQFLTEHAHQRVILQIRNIDAFYESQHWDLLNAIGASFKNFIVCINPFCAFHELTDQERECVKHLNMPYMFGMQISNFEQLNYILNTGVCSVYVANEICFDLYHVKVLCNRYNVQVRAFANVAQSSISTTPALKKFFIRPEDIEEYADCIDIVEFWGPLNRQHILHRIYTKGIWYGDLDEIICDLHFSFDSRCIVPEFAQIRKNCDRKCIKGRKCDACKLIYDYSQELKLNNEGLNLSKND